MPLPRYAALLFAVVMTACVPSAPAPQPPIADADACGATPLQGLVGQPATVLETMKFAQPVRILRPGMAVTMDFRADRLNIAVDERGRIERVYCS